MGLTLATEHRGIMWTSVKRIVRNWKKVTLQENVLKTEDFSNVVSGSQYKLDLAFDNVKPKD